MKSLVRFGALNANGHGYIDANAIISIVFTTNLVVTVTYAPSRTVTITSGTADSTYVLHNFITDILIGAAQSSVKPSAGASSTLAIPSSLTIGGTTYALTFAVA
jgi:hypothetical protein